MLTKEDILLIMKKNKPKFNELGVISIGLFGSYAKDKQQKHSDIDVLVEITKPDWNVLCTIWDILEKQLHSKVDLIRVGPHLRDKFLESIEKEIIYA
jgi:predicted nucleotidyltransferase